MATHTKHICDDFFYTGLLITSRHATHETLIKLMTELYATLKNVVYQGQFSQQMTPQNKIVCSTSKKRCLQWSITWGPMSNKNRR